MRFGRKSGPNEPDPAPETELEPEPSTPLGPLDESEVDLDEHDGIDLGSLLVTPVGEMELQLQVDEHNGEVMAVVLVAEDGALELRAFASSRGGGAWDELRPRISGEMARLGGTSDEREGAYGAELLCMVPVQTPDGQPATQASRILGFEGRAWLLRATMMGPAALEEELPSHWQETIRRVVVRRGRDAMPPGAPLHLHLPPEARRIDGPPSED